MQITDPVYNPVACWLDNMCREKNVEFTTFEFADRFAKMYDIGFGDDLSSVPEQRLSEFVAILANSQDYLILSDPDFFKNDKYAKEVICAINPEFESDIRQIHGYGSVIDFYINLLLSCPPAELMIWQIIFTNELFKRLYE